MDLNYELKNINKIDSDLFEIIKNHYSKLDLLKRFRENSDNVISELENTIHSNLLVLAIDKIKDVIKEDCYRNREIHGFNYWKIILKLTLIKDQTFINKFR